MPLIGEPHDVFARRGSCLVMNASIRKCHGIAIAQHQRMDIRTTQSHYILIKSFRLTLLLRRRKIVQIQGTQQQAHQTNAAASTQTYARKGVISNLYNIISINTILCGGFARHSSTCIPIGRLYRLTPTTANAAIKQHRTEN